MSPLTLALLGYLAYKGVKHLSGSTEPGGAAASGGGWGGLLSGGLGGLLNGGIGSMLSNGSAGSALSGGLAALLRQFQESGQGDKANSWVSQGPNKDISEGTCQLNR